MSDTVDIKPSEVSSAVFQSLDAEDLGDVYVSETAPLAPGPGAFSDAAAQGVEEEATDPPAIAGAAPGKPAPAENGETAAEEPVSALEVDPSRDAFPPAVAEAGRVELTETLGGRSLLRGAKFAGRRRLWAAVAFGSVLCLALAGAQRSGYFQLPYENPHVQRFKLVEPQSQPAPSAPAPPEAAAPPRDWAAKLDEIDALRQTLTIQRSGIQALSQTCQYGVLELEEELAGWVRRSGSDSLQQSLRDKRIEFLLRSIQRRQAYVDAMEKPLNLLDAAGEELLYLKRRASLDLQVQEISDRLDLEAHWRQIHSVIARVQPVMRELSVDIEGPYPRQPLEFFWKRALETVKSTALPNDDARSAAITHDICSGDLSRVAELSRLTLKSARCLTESPAQDLFLTRLADLTPNAAMKLRDWPGQWLCLNGLKRIPPEVGKHLFAWPGGCLSLNGINELTAGSARFLPSWSGRQLELMGLQKSNGLDYLIQWEDAGGRLFVPDAIRREIETLRSLSAQRQASR